LQGGNYNFAIALSPSDLSCDADRCNGIHITDSGRVHLDTANPWGGIGGFFEHAFVDGLLGNYAYGVIPRPWPWGR
jgi:hypothetical protein